MEGFTNKLILNLQNLYDVTLLVMLNLYKFCIVICQKCFSLTIVIIGNNVNFASFKCALKTFCR